MSERLPTLKAKDVVRVLQKDGFVLVHQKGSHATYKHPVTQKRVTIPIHPGKDLKRGLLRGILNDLILLRQNFLENFNRSAKSLGFFNLSPDFATSETRGRFCGGHFHSVTLTDRPLSRSSWLR